MLSGNTSVLSGGESGNDSYTKLLLHFDSQLDSAVGASKRRIITPYNAPFNATKKFGTGSIFFNGTGSSYVLVENSADFDFGSGNFTVDWWEYRLNAIDGAAMVRRQIDNNVQGYLLGHATTNRGKIYMSSNGSSWDVANGIDMGAFDFGQWTHYAVVRNGNTFRTYKNGTVVTEWGSTLALLSAPANSSMTLGHWNGNGVNGYLDELRISKGIARWTANFAPPQRAYGPNQDYSAWHTVYLNHFNNITNAGGTSFVDSSPYNKGSTSATGYGHPYDAFGTGGSIFFNGANTYAVVTGSEDFNFGSGDFTIDWRDWRSDDVAGRPAMVRTTTTLTYQPFLVGYTSGNLYCYCSNDAVSWNILSALSLGPLSINSWSHRAFVRKNGIFYGFKDGVLQASYAGSAAPLPNRTTEPMFLGVWNYEGGQNWGYGLMDELRISKGIGRWTANFTPPNAPY
jgi:hypothetical protein